MKKIASMALGSALLVLSFVSLTAMIPSVAVAGTGTNTPDPTASTTPSVLSFTVPNPLGNNTTTLNGFLANVLSAIVLLLTPVIVIMLVYCGFLFVTAQGKEEELTKAKQALLYTLIGAAVVLGAKGLALVLQNTITCLASSTTGC